MFTSNLVASWAVNRLIIQPGDPYATPPVPEIKESDDALRLRGLLARDGLSVAGLTGAYEFFALSVDGRVVGAMADMILQATRASLAAFISPHLCIGVTPCFFWGLARRPLLSPDSRASR